MKKIILWAAALFSAVVHSQTVVQIGTGTLSTGGVNYMPIYRSSAASTFDYSRTYFLYTAAEMAAAGIPAGSTITKVEWDKSNTGATVASTANIVFNIYMNNSSSTGYTTAQTWATLTSGATQVYNNNNQVIPATTGFLPFTLTTPFVYSGAALEIATDWDISAVSGNPTTAAFNFSYTTIANRTGGTSNSTALTGASSLGTQTGRPNIRITYTPPPACSGTPNGGTAVASTTYICSPQNVNLSLSGSTAASGLTYSWQSSPDGLTWTSIPTGTTIGITQSVTATTYYQAIVSCGTNSAVSSVVTVSYVPVISTVPYSEGFEGIPANNVLPNCSWAASNLPTICQTYTASGSNNRIPKTGAKFASFRYGTNTAGDYFYTNGIQLSAGVNYLASADYVTDGASGWSEFRLLYGTSQSTTGLTSIAAITGALTNTVYANLNGTFSVSATGVYYLAIKAIGNSTPWYLSFDDVSVTVAPTCSASPYVGTITGPTNIQVASTNTFAIASSTGNIQWVQGTSASGPFSAISNATNTSQAITSINTGTIYYTAIASAPGCSSYTGTPIAVVVNPMPGDLPCTASALPIGPSSTYYNLFYYTASSGEVAPPGTSCTTNTTWCNATLNNTRWFTFTAPASGNVSVQSPGFDTQLAVWSTPSCSALISPTNAILIAANDDDPNYTAHSGAQFSSYVRALCLTPGATYYIQLDSYSNTTSADSTKILITDLGANSFTGPASSYCLPSTASASLVPNIPGGAFTINNSTTTVTAFTPSVVGAGTHTVNYNAFGCISSSVVVVNAQPNITIATSGTAVCLGNTMTVTASGAATYSWSTSANTASITVTPTANSSYTVVGTSTAGCTNTTVATVTVNSLPVINVSGTTSICQNGTANLTAAGASTYTWNTGSTSANIAPSPTVTTSYTVNGTDANGCVNSTVQSVTVNPLPVVSISGPTATCIGSSVNLTASGANSYSWSTGSTSVSISDMPTSNTSYTVTGTNTVTGCSNTASQAVVVNSLPTVAVSGTSVICAGQTATITANGASTYTWNAAAVSNSITVNPTTNTSYTVTGANGAGCTNTAVATVTVNNLPTVTVSGTTSICQNGSANLTANGASTYTWNTGATTANISPTLTVTTTYTVDGTDANGCTNSAVQTVTVNSLPAVSISGPTATCIGSLLTLTGNGANTYSWSTGSTATTATDTPSSNTTYSVTGTNSVTGCSNTASQTVVVNALPVVSVSGSSAICAGQIATLTASGASTYTWNTNANTASITDSPASTTTYTVNGTDANGCSNSAVQSVTVNSLPVVSITGANSVCDGTSANLSANGASSYSWSTGSSGTSISVTPSVTAAYTVTGTDNNNCSNTASFTVSVNPNPTVSVAGGAVCPGGSFTLAPTGAVTYTYMPNGPIVSPGSTTTYSISGTDANGCVTQTAATAVVTVTNNLSVTVSGNAVICAGQSTSLTAGGAAAYSWNTGASTSTIMLTPTVNTTYSVTGSSGSCSNTAVVTITVNSLPAVSLAASSTTLCDNGQTVTLTGSPAGGVYSGSNVTGNMFTSTTAGTFTPVYSFTNSSTGCSNTANTTLVVSVCTDIRAVGGTDGLQVYPNPTTGAFTIDLNNGMDKTIEVTDPSGRIILLAVTEKNTFDVNIAQFANGVYFVKVLSNNSVKVIKVVKQ